MTDDLVNQLGYFGIPLLLILGGLGVPIPEEGPIILAAVLSKNGTLWWPLAFASCLVGVLIGDFIVYVIGYVQGERVLNFGPTRKLISRERQAQIKGYFERHGFKILLLGRFAVGFRTAAYLTAGMLRLPPLKLLLTDLVAALLSTSLIFGMGYLFAQQIEWLVQTAQYTIAYLLGGGIVLALSYRFFKSRSRLGKVVGPPVALEVQPLPHGIGLVAANEPIELERPDQPTAETTALEESGTAPSLEVIIRLPVLQEDEAVVSPVQANPAILLNQMATADPRPPEIAAHQTIAQPTGSVDLGTDAAASG